ncbi:hypothetical protein CBR_g13034 [Chara braunii]|uniref:Reverse transcriptase zinc-binding domain-containing protein n=1 Tax=Chara braunii TaxID=69332 RepID=A0A388KTC6_CHABU|nr:hypothetical protein CBR_g13034 [Chara braunii]|eukprot:GBG73315.1 hypothetical protein CBR_g13034 [Chara braunii]
MWRRSRSEGLAEYRGMADQGNVADPDNERVAAPPARTELPMSEKDRMKLLIAKCYEDGIIPEKFCHGEWIVEGGVRLFKVNPRLDTLVTAWLKERTVTVIFQGEARDLPLRIKEDLIRAYENGWYRERVFDHSIKRGRIHGEGPNVLSYVAKASEVARWMIVKGEDKVVIRGIEYAMVFKPWMTKAELEERRRAEDATKFWVMALRVPLRVMFHVESMMALFRWMEAWSLEDVFRTMNPVSPGYTWFGTASPAAGVKRRLDYFLVSDHLAKAVLSSHEETESLSDHKPVFIVVRTSEDLARGPGCFRLNKLVLEEEGIKEWTELFLEQWKQATELFDSKADWMDAGLRIISQRLDTYSRIATDDLPISADAKTGNYGMRWIQRGVATVADLWDYLSNSSVSDDQLKEKLGQLPYLEARLLELRNSIPVDWVTLMGPEGVKPVDSWYAEKQCGTTIFYRLQEWFDDGLGKCWLEEYRSLLPNLPEIVLSGISWRYGLNGLEEIRVHRLPPRSLGEPDVLVVVAEAVSLREMKIDPDTWGWQLDNEPIWGLSNLSSTLVLTIRSKLPHASEIIADRWQRQCPEIQPPSDKELSALWSQLKVVPSQKLASLAWLQSHLAVPTAKWLQDRQIEVNTQCDRCLNATESMQHLWWEWTRCVLAAEFITYAINIINLLQPPPSVPKGVAVHFLIVHILITQIFILFCAQGRYQDCMMPHYDERPDVFLTHVDSMSFVRTVLMGWSMLAVLLNAVLK